MQSKTDGDYGIYHNAKPFKHIVYKDFITPTSLLDSVLADWPGSGNPYWRQHANQKQCFSSFNHMSVDTQHVLKILYTNVREAIEHLTGIRTLLADKYLVGAGLHENFNGGRLGIHVDFNTIKNLHRRVNLLLFLNKDWRPEWGGQLELWDGEKPYVIIEPTFNTCVIFEASENSYHGHPKTLTCPPQVSRKSIAMYYYTEGVPQGIKSHSTKYIN